MLVVVIITPALVAPLRAATAVAAAVPRAAAAAAPIVVIAAAARLAWRAVSPPRARTARAAATARVPPTTGAAVVSPGVPAIVPVITAVRVVSAGDRPCARLSAQFGPSLSNPLYSGNVYTTCMRWRVIWPVAVVSRWRTIPGPIGHPCIDHCVANFDRVNPLCIEVTYVELRFWHVTMHR